MRYLPHGSRRRGHPDSATDALACGLGVFSIALGFVELVAARPIARTLGMWGHHDLVRVYGLRKIATGAGILAAKDRTPGIWARVAGDALDIATLVPGLNRANRKSGNVAIALAAAAGATAVDLYCARALSRSSPVPLAPVRDYSGRSGLPRPPDAMRGAARDVLVPRDFRTPEPLRPRTESA